jgi:hypothetical protein
LEVAVAVAYSALGQTTQAPVGLLAATAVAAVALLIPAVMAATAATVLPSFAFIFED